MQDISLYTLTALPRVYPIISLAVATGRYDEPRILPHQYFIRTVRTTLQAIAIADPGSTVDISIFTEGWYGGISDDPVGLPVDETGELVEWKIPTDCCEELGLTCTQVYQKLSVNEGRQQISKAERISGDSLGGK